MNQHLRFFSQRGFTLLEVVVALIIIAGMAAMYTAAMGPGVAERARSDTERRLGLLKTAVESAYAQHSFTIDNTDTFDAGSALGQLNLGPGNIIASRCPALMGNPFDPAQETNILPLQAFTGASVQELAKDGYNNSICTYISRRARMVYEGAELLYHVVAFVSPGINNRIDAGTELSLNINANGDQIWNLKTMGDDTGVVIDGSKWAIEHYKLNKSRLNRFARGYETYFKSRLNSRRERELKYNYFYATQAGDILNGEPLGPSDVVVVGGTAVPGSYDPTPERGFVLPTNPNVNAITDYHNVVDTGLWYILGLSDNEIQDAWSNAVLVDNNSDFVRNGTRGAPFTARFLIPSPGVDTCTSPDPSQCKYLLSATVTGAY